MQETVAIGNMQRHILISNVPITADLRLEPKKLRKAPRGGFARLAAADVAALRQLLGERSLAPDVWFLFCRAHTAFGVYRVDSKSGFGFSGKFGLDTD